MGDISYFVHGTTLALNALLTRTGARVAIVTTAGFRDVFELGRTDREPMYDLSFKKPQSLVPRSLVFEVPERLAWDGAVSQPVDQAAVKEQVLSSNSGGGGGWGPALEAGLNAQETAIAETPGGGCRVQVKAAGPLAVAG